MKKPLSSIEKIDELGICLGCGLCESVCGKPNVEMEMREDGFFHPRVKSVTAEQDMLIAAICPGLNINNDIPFFQSERIWGKIEYLGSGYSTSEKIRNLGSSGGFISALAVNLLEYGEVDAVLQVGGDEADFKGNRLKVSRTREDVLACASSRYAPALVLHEIIKLFQSTDESYCFIGKPCDISGLKNLLLQYPEYSRRIKLTVAIICAGMPSFSGTEALIRGFNPPHPIRSLKYRGGGWPGNFSFEDTIGQTHRMTYNDSWGNVLGRYVHYRCKICPDGIGLQADVVVGDAWETNDGYPDFSEKPGVSLVLVRTQLGMQSIAQAVKNKHLHLVGAINKESLSTIQPYQYARRKRVGARVLAFVAVKACVPRFRKVGIWRNMIFENPYRVVREFLGSIRRLVHARK